MKIKIVAFALVLTVMSWAQSTTTSTQAQATDQKSAETKTNCPCCDKIASGDHKDMAACMRHNASGKKDKAVMPCCSSKDAKDAASGCTGKYGKSCVKGDAASAACCAGGQCGEGHEMACCSDKDRKKTANDCCGGKQCGKPDHAATPGN